jgi:hypothetical protein
MPLDLQFVSRMLNINNKISIGTTRYFMTNYEYCHIMSRHYMTLIPYDTSCLISVVALIKLDPKKIFISLFLVSKLRQTAK